MSEIARLQREEMAKIFSMVRKLFDGKGTPPNRGETLAVFKDLEGAVDGLFDVIEQQERDIKRMQSFR